MDDFDGNEIDSATSISESSLKMWYSVSL